MFTYKIYSNSLRVNIFYMVLYPTKEFFKKYPIGGSDILQEISNDIILCNNIPFISNKSILLNVSFYDRLLNNIIIFEIIKFYLNDVGYYKNSIFNTKIQRWTCQFEITNISMLLEIL